MQLLATTIRLPSNQFEIISLDDVIFFIVMILFGGEAAILVVMVGTFSVRVGPIYFWTRCFNVSAMAITFFLTVWALRFTLGPIPNIFANIYSPLALVGLGLAVLTAVLVNTIIVGLHQAIKHQKPFLQAWLSSSNGKGTTLSSWTFRCRRWTGLRRRREFAIRTLTGCVLSS
jgi:hypothetical protein